MRPRRTSLIAALLCLGLWVATFDASSASSSETIDLIQEENANTISFRENVAFISPSGEEITPSIGRYRVEPVGLSALRLVPFEKKDVVVIKAQTTTHEEDVGDPVALLAIDDDYLFHVVLLLPERRGLEAIGSSSRGRHRGSPELLTPAQIRDAFNRKKAGPRTPDSPTPTQKP